MKYFGFMSLRQSVSKIIVRQSIVMENSKLVKKLYQFENLKNSKHTSFSREFYSESNADVKKRCIVIWC